VMSEEQRTARSPPARSRGGRSRHHDEGVRGTSFDAYEQGQMRYREGEPKLRMRCPKVLGCQMRPQSRHHGDRRIVVMAFFYIFFITVCYIKFKSFF
jgi:hypothetical protein